MQTLETLVTPANVVEVQLIFKEVNVANSRKISQKVARQLLAEKLTFNTLCKEARIEANPFVELEAHQEPCEAQIEAVVICHQQAQDTRLVMLETTYMNPILTTIATTILTMMNKLILTIGRTATIEKTL